MNKDIAVIGCGYWGKNLVRNFAGLGALHTVCDADPEALARVASLYAGVVTASDYRHVLASPEIKGVVIATPAALHYRLAREALLAGKDVFVEKPLALKVGEGRELVALAEERRLILLDTITSSVINESMRTLSSRLLESSFDGFDHPRV